MNIETKFEIGDWVWIPNQRSIWRRKIKGIEHFGDGLRYIVDDGRRFQDFQMFEDVKEAADALEATNKRG